MRIGDGAFRFGGIARHYAAVSWRAFRPVSNVWNGYRWAGALAIPMHVGA
ncbi:hypothetical protein C7S17_6153 [Burkholderia thailandensis]|nr:hypothetical protein [Burkholderia thailandensis]